MNKNRRASLRDIAADNVKAAIVGEMMTGQVDVVADIPILAAEPVHEVIRGYGIPVTKGDDDLTRTPQRLHVEAGDPVIVNNDDRNLLGRVGTVTMTGFLHGVPFVKVRFTGIFEDAPKAAVIHTFRGKEVGYVVKYITATPPVPAGVRIMKDGEDITRDTLLTVEGNKRPSLRDSVIGEAADIISGERAAAYGDAAEDFGRIAAMWSAILGVEVPTEKVAMMMVAVKLSRLSQSPAHRDSWVDVIGYAGLGAEVAKVDPR